MRPAGLEALPDDRAAGTAGGAAAAASQSQHPSTLRGLGRLIPVLHDLPIELLASGCGFAICLLFICHPQSPDTPASVIASMAFTTTACPLLMHLTPAFYRRHRTPIVLLVRLAFAHGTLHNFDELRAWQTGQLSWPALLATLLYSTRTLVMAGWGAFGFQLPLPLFAATQAAHAAAAAVRLPPELCRPGGALLHNSDKLQWLALLLDMPLRLVGGLPLVMPARGACLAVATWVQFVGALLIPTAVLVWMQQRRAAAAARAAGAATEFSWHTREPERWPLVAVSLCAAGLAWLALRTALHSVE